MKTGQVDINRVVSILNRLRIAPDNMRRSIIQELIDCADEDRGEVAGEVKRVRGSYENFREHVLQQLARNEVDLDDDADDDDEEDGDDLDQEPAPKAAPHDPSKEREQTLRTLRDMLTWPETKSNPRATARIARMLRKARNEGA